MGPSFAYENYVELTIPLEVLSDRQDGQTEFNFEISSDESPLPSQTQISTQAGTRAGFGPIAYTRPGIYSYQIRQIAGTDPDYDYDTRIYALTVYVSRGIDGLEVSLVANLGQSDQENKRDIIFSNTYIGKDGYPDGPTPRPEDSGLLEWLLWKYPDGQIKDPTDITKPSLPKDTYDKIIKEDLDFIIILRDKTVITSDGQILIPDGIVIDLRGIITLADGSEIQLDGRLIGNRQVVEALLTSNFKIEEGILIHKNGLTINPDGSILLSNGLVIEYVNVRRQADQDLSSEDQSKNLQVYIDGKPSSDYLDSNNGKIPDDIKVIQDPNESNISSMEDKDGLGYGDSSGQGSDTHANANQNSNGQNHTKPQPDRISKQGHISSKAKTGPVQTGQTSPLLWLILFVVAGVLYLIIEKNSKKDN